MTKRAAWLLGSALLASATLGPAGCGDGSRTRGPEYPAAASTEAAGDASASGETSQTGQTGQTNHARTPRSKGKVGKGKRPRSASATSAKKEEVAREVGAVQKGFAVWYGGDLHGKPTASGEAFDKHAMTAAHRSLPMGTTVRVTNGKNGTSVTVRINDRGPFGKRRERIIDVSEAAGKILGILDDGNCPITLEVLTLPASRKDPAR
jgi:rare lipoprotein A